MNRIESLYQQNSKPAAFARGYLNYLKELLDALDAEAVARFIEVMLDAREKGARIFFIGNGGSAATASHFANDIGIGTRSSGKPFRALSLTDNVAVLTAIANDYGYEDVFVAQLRTLMHPGDIVVAISASGNSPNILKAIDYANRNQGYTIGVTGFDGGGLRERSMLSLHVPSNRGEYGPVEDMHMVLDHLLGAYLMQVCYHETEAKQANARSAAAAGEAKPLDAET